MRRRCQDLSGSLAAQRRDFRPRGGAGGGRTVPFSWGDGSLRPKFRRQRRGPGRASARSRSAPCMGSSGDSSGPRRSLPARGGFGHASDRGSGSIRRLRRCEEGLYQADDAGGRGARREGARESWVWGVGAEDLEWNGKVAKIAIEALNSRDYAGIDLFVGDFPWLVDVNPRPTTSVVWIAKVMPEEMADFILRVGSAPCRAGWRQAGYLSLGRVRWKFSAIKFRMCSLRTNSNLQRIWHTAGKGDAGHIHDYVGHKEPQSGGAYKQMNLLEFDWLMICANMPRSLLQGTLFDSALIVSLLRFNA